MSRRKNITVTDEYIGDTINKNITLYDYYNQLTQIALTIFEWVNVPPTIDVRFLELSLFYRGYVIFFKDEELGYLCMRGTLGGGFNNYNIPIERDVMAPNGYHRRLDEKNSVIIYDNLMHTLSTPMTLMYAKKLYQFDETIKVNLNAQKTPILILCDDKQELTVKNLYKKYDGNSPVIFGTSDLTDLNKITSINTGAPYLVHTLIEDKANTWNEALTYLGVPNIKDIKKERMLVDEVNRMQGGAFASQYSKLIARKQACEQINRMFNLEKPIDCVVRSEYTSEYGGVESE